MQVLNIFHVLIAIAMVAFILIQKGAGATAGAAFGSGASGTVFGSRGAGTFLSRSTWVMAALFCLISLSMAVIASRMSLSPETDLGVVGGAPVATQAPVAEPPVTGTSGDATDLPSISGAAEKTATSQDNGDVPVLDPESTPAAANEELSPGKKADDEGSGDGSP